MKGKLGSKFGLNLISARKRVPTTDLLTAAINLSTKGVFSTKTANVVGLLYFMMVLTVIRGFFSAVHL